MDNNRKRHKCPVCGKIFNKKCGLIDHLRDHGMLPFSCVECGRPFIKKGNLNKHLKTHNLPGFSCKICTPPKFFFNVRQMMGHRHEFEDLSTGGEEDQDDVEEEVDENQNRRSSPAEDDFLRENFPLTQRNLPSNSSRPRVVTEEYIQPRESDEENSISSSDNQRNVVQRRLNDFVKEYGLQGLRLMLGRFDNPISELYREYIRNLNSTPRNQASSGNNLFRPVTVDTEEVNTQIPNLLTPEMSQQLPRPNTPPPFREPQVRLYKPIPVYPRPPPPPRIVTTKPPRPPRRLPPTSGLNGSSHVGLNGTTNVNSNHSSNGNSNHSSNPNSNHSSNLNSHHSSNFNSNYSSNRNSNHSSNRNSNHSSNRNSNHSSNLNSHHSSNLNSNHSSPRNSNHSSNLNSNNSSNLRWNNSSSFHPINNSYNPQRFHIFRPSSPPNSSSNSSKSSIPSLISPLSSSSDSSSSKKKFTNGEDDTGNHRCNYCRRRFSSRNDLIIHIASHLRGPFIACHVCQLPFSRMEEYQRHLTTHSNDPTNFVCGLCRRYFNDKETLKTHRLLHLRFTFCNKCKKIFAYPSELMIHLMEFEDDCYDAITNPGPSRRPGLTSEESSFSSDDDD